MPESPHIIKAIKALRSHSGDPIDRIPYISEDMAERLVALGYAGKRPWDRNPSIDCYFLTKAGHDALDAKSAGRPKIPMLQPRIKTVETHIKAWNGNRDGDDHG